MVIEKRPCDGQMTAALAAISAFAIAIFQLRVRWAPTFEVATEFPMSPNTGTPTLRSAFVNVSTGSRQGPTDLTKSCSDCMIPWGLVSACDVEQFIGDFALELAVADLEFGWFVEQRSSLF